jgi:hypothetical protein
MGRYSKESATGRSRLLSGLLAPARTGKYYGRYGFLAASISS